MLHLGDIKNINGAEIPVVDVITGGSPCQDLSVAGRREGLAGERSGLFMEQIRIIKEMRERDRNDGRTGELIRPRYMVWENVPGAFSSGNPKGEDFRIVIEETARVADETAAIPRPEGGVDTIRMYLGKRVVDCLESTRCTVLGSAPTKKENLACRRFCRRKCTRSTF